VGAVRHRHGRLLRKAGCVAVDDGIVDPKRAACVAIEAACATLWEMSPKNANTQTTTTLPLGGLVVVSAR
jgi:hypothetical protein